ADFLRVLEARRTYKVIPVLSEHEGYWEPPDVAGAKELVKGGQAAAEKLSEGTEIDHQFGLRLLVSPGDWVGANQPVMEIRYPRGLEGAVAGEYVASGPSILGQFPA
ncbi:unnamed protein product, partial [marine sediment metagenome]